MNSAEIPRSREVCAPGIPPRTAERAGQRIPRTASSSAAYSSWPSFALAVIAPFPLPASRSPRLQLDLALRRLDVLEKAVNDLLGSDAFGFRGKVRKDAMTENNIAYYMTEAGLDLNKAWQLVSGALNPEAWATRTGAASSLHEEPSSVS